MRDTRPRIKYILPDNRPITVICDHGQVPADIIPFELSPSDPLWDRAQQMRGSKRRLVHATRAVGL